MSEFFSRLRRLARWHRRKIAAILAGLSVILALNAFSSPGSDLQVAQIAVKNLSAGHVLSAEDITESQIPAQFLPADAIDSADTLIGKRLVGAMSKNSIFTSANLFESKEFLADGQQLVPIRIADQDIWQLIQVGDLVNVITADQSVLAQNLAVVAVPQTEQSATRSGKLILVMADRKTAQILAGVGASENLAITFSQ